MGKKTNKKGYTEADIDKVKVMFDGEEITAAEASKIMEAPSLLYDKDLLGIPLVFVSVSFVGERMFKGDKVLDFDIKAMIEETKYIVSFRTSHAYALRLAQLIKDTQNRVRGKIVKSDKGYYNIMPLVGFGSVPVAKKK